MTRPAEPSADAMLASPDWWPSTSVDDLRLAHPGLQNSGLLGVHDAANPASLPALAHALAQGQLVAFPTETVYGLGARADDDAAVARIYAAKGRPAGHPLIVHVADAQAARAFVQEIPPVAQALMDAFWPGPLTLVLPRATGIGLAAAGGHDTLALRCPGHPLALALLREALACGVAGVAAPSANRFGHVSPTHAGHVADEFTDLPPHLAPLHLLAGVGCDCAVGIESTIVDVSRAQPVLLRPGGLTRWQLEAVLGQSVALRDADAPRVSGDMASHYAPEARLLVLSAAELFAHVSTPSWKQARHTTAVYAQAEVMQHLKSSADSALEGCAATLIQPNSAQQAAHDLFAALRHLDRVLAEGSGAGQIVVQALPPGEDWDGVRDRLQRAAAPRPSPIQ